LCLGLFERLQGGRGLLCLLSTKRQAREQDQEGKDNPQAKRLWGLTKVRYRRLAKNANRAYVMLAMIHLKKWGRPLTGEVDPV
jgi:hypothetical protein